MKLHKVIFLLAFLFCHINDLKAFIPNDLELSCSVYFDPNDQVDEVRIELNSIVKIAFDTTDNFYVFFEIGNAFQVQTIISNSGQSLTLVSGNSYKWEINDHPISNGNSKIILKCKILDYSVINVGAVHSFFYRNEFDDYNTDQYLGTSSLQYYTDDIADCSYSLPPPPCENCLYEFSPTPGRYMISAWTSNSNWTPNLLNIPGSSIELFFPNTSTTTSIFPSGNIIEGWQKIEKEIEVIPNEVVFNIRLKCLTGDCYFDDIRFYPTDGSMLSYTYDPTTQRLVAELDERNYATFYEYNEEGKLTRIKKETERGIMTIQENRESLKKEP